MALVKWIKFSDNLLLRLNTELCFMCLFVHFSIEFIFSVFLYSQFFPITNLCSNLFSNFFFYSFFLSFYSLTLHFQNNTDFIFVSFSEHLFPLLSHCKFISIVSSSSLFRCNKIDAIYTEWTVKSHQINLIWIYRKCI